MNRRSNQYPRQEYLRSIYLPQDVINEELRTARTPAEIRATNIEELRRIYEKRPLGASFLRYSHVYVRTQILVASIRDEEVDLERERLREIAFSGGILLAMHATFKVMPDGERRFLLDQPFDQRVYADPEDEEFAEYFHHIEEMTLQRQDSFYDEFQDLNPRVQEAVTEYAGRMYEDYYPVQYRETLSLEILRGYTFAHTTIDDLRDEFLGRTKNPRIIGM